MLLAITIWIITLISVVGFAGGFWWFPVSASAHGAQLDNQFVVTLVVTGVIFILAQVALGYFIIRYRITTQIISICIFIPVLILI